MAAATTDTTIDFQALSTGKVGFIEEHNLWSPEQRDAAERVLADVRDRGLETVRVAFGDVHGIVRGKSLSVRAFESAMRNGMDSSPGPFIFDTALDVVFDPFEPGGGFGLEEMIGAGDFVLVPDPLTFRVLPWAPDTGWLLADEYFKTGAPIPFSGRLLLKRLLGELRARGLEYVAGIEVEWYLLKVLDPVLAVEAVGGFGQPGAPPEVAPVNLGYQFNIELFNDQLDDILRVLRHTLLALGMPLRTTEHESGPGQLEFTFEPLPGLDAADMMLLFRSAAKQVCWRHGYHASFMCCPGLQGFDASGWHLHQSLFTIEGGANAFMSTGPEVVSDLARHYAGGLIEHARAASVFTVPTINGYKRLSERFSLSPDRAVWSVDNRGTFIRVLGEPGELSTHLENRVGEPAANPYLYMASQIIAGLDGIDRKLEPEPLTDDPHAHDRPALPTSLREAVDALKADALFAERAGRAMIDFVVTLKEHELARYESAIADLPEEAHRDVVTDWEHREYFRTF